MSEFEINELINKIKARRLELGLSYQELSNLTGISKSTLQRYETGFIKKVPITQIKVIAKALNISPSYLMGWEDNITPVLSSRDEKDIAKRLESMMSDLTEKQAALMFDGEPLDDEDVELLKISLENTLRLAKMRAKQKFTPRKYKK